jgi:hypothetical protein
MGSALPSEASNLRIAPDKPALEAEHSCPGGPQFELKGEALRRGLRQ